MKQIGHKYAIPAKSEGNTKTVDVSRCMPWRRKRGCCLGKAQQWNTTIALGVWSGEVASTIIDYIIFRFTPPGGNELLTSRVKISCFAQMNCHQKERWISAATPRYDLHRFGRARAAPSG